MAATEQSMKFNLTLSEAERTELLTLLERETRETHAEARRTESPDYQEEVHRHENILQGLLENLRRS